MEIRIFIDSLEGITLSSRKIRPLRRNGGTARQQQETTLQDILPGVGSRMEEDVEAKLLWLSVRERLSPKQRRMVELRADGLTDAELAGVFRLRCEDVRVAFDRIRGIALECIGL